MNLLKSGKQYELLCDRFFKKISFKLQCFLKNFLAKTYHNGTPDILSNSDMDYVKSNIVTFIHQI